jgi:hypothetical protein
MFEKIDGIEDDYVLGRSAPETVSTPETSFSLGETTLHNIPEDSHLHIRRRENLRFHLDIVFLYSDNSNAISEQKFLLPASRTKQYEQNVVVAWLTHLLHIQKVSVSISA